MLVFFAMMSPPKSTNIYQLLVFLGSTAYATPRVLVQGNLRNDSKKYSTDRAVLSVSISAAFRQMPKRGIQHRIAVRAARQQGLPGGAGCYRTLVCKERDIRPDELDGVMHDVAGEHHA
jgi:hypothetical protein